jgi:hypothetical protein
MSCWRPPASQGRWRGEHVAFGRFRRHPALRLADWGEAEALARDYTAEAAYYGEPPVRKSAAGDQHSRRCVREGGMALLKRTPSFRIEDEFLEEDYDATAPPVVAAPAVSVPEPPAPPSAQVPPVEAAAAQPVVLEQDTEAISEASAAAAPGSEASSPVEPAAAPSSSRRRAARPLLALLLLALAAGSLGLGLAHHGAPAAPHIAARPHSDRPVVRPHYRPVRHRPQRRRHRHGRARPQHVRLGAPAPAPAPVPAAPGETPAPLPAAPSGSGSGGEFVIGG